MAPDTGRRRRLQRLFDRALDLPSHERRAFLLEESSEDASLREEVEALLDPRASPAASSEEGDETLPWAERGTDRPPLMAAAGAPHRWGHLEILKKLGQGHFGEVYLCRDPSLDRVVALKLFRDDTGSRQRATPLFLKRIEREGRLLARVEHPNVLRVYGVGVHGGAVGLWMEYVRGKTLAEVMRSQGRYGAREASVVGADICAALAAVHAHGVLHRDIKAQNVIREDGGRIILMDFGAGHDLIDASRDQGDQVAAPAGTPLYMAPELLAGEAATVRSDLYNVGVLLFHLVTGSYPVRADSLAELKHKHERGEVTLLRDLRPDLPARFVRAVETALQADPARRFGSAGEMQRTLEVATDLLEESRATTLETIIGPIRRVLNAVAVAFGAAVFLGGMGLVTSASYRFAFGIPAEYAEQSALDYMVWGVRALVPVLFYALLISLLLGLSWWPARLVLRLMSRVRRGRQLSSRSSQWLRKMAEADANRNLAWVLALGIVGLVGAYLMNRRLLGTIFGPLHNVLRSRQADLSVLSTDSTALHHLFELSFSALLLLIAVATFIVSALAKARRQRLNVWILGGIVIAALVASSLAVVPWRLLWENNRELVLCKSGENTTEETFLVSTWSRGDECRYWLYDPKSRDRRGVLCSELTGSERCRRTGRYRYVFGGSFDR